MSNINNFQDLIEKDIYQVLFENSMCAKLLVDENNFIQKVNNTFTSFFGYNSLEIKGQKISTLLPNHNQAKYFENLIKSPEEKIYGSVRKVDAIKKDGTVFTIEMSLEKIGGMIAVTIYKDIFPDLRSQLFDKETTYALATKAAHVGVWSATLGFDKQSNKYLKSFKWVINDEVKYLLGFPLNRELKLVDYMTVIHPEDSGKVIDAISNSFKSGVDYDVTYRINRSDLGIKHINSKGKVLCDDDNRPYRLDGGMVDVSDLVNAKKTIKESESRLSNFFELAPNGIIKNDIDGNFVSVNKEFERYTGYSRTELCKLDFWDLTPKKYEEQELIQFKLLKAKGYYGPYEKEFVHKNGEQVPVLLNGVKIKDDIDGKDYIWSIVVNMTESIRVKKNLMDYERFFSLNQDMICMLSSDGEILELNSKIITSLGFSEEYIKQVSFLDLFHQDDKVTAEKAFLGMYSGDIIQNFKGRLLCHDGVIIWLVFSALVVEESGHLFIVAKDVTEIEKAERKVDLLNKDFLDSEQKYRELFHKSGDATIIIENGIIVDCNDAFIELYGEDSRSYYINQSSNKLMPVFQPSGVDSLKEMQEFASLVNEIGSIKIECYHVNIKGVLFPVEEMLTTIVNNPDKKIVYSVIRDITDRVEREKELREHRDLLRNSQQLAKMGSWKWNMDTDYVFLSDELNLIYELDADNLNILFETYLSFTHLIDRERVRDLISDAIKNKINFQYNCRIKNKNGDIRYLKSWGNTILNDKKEVIGMYGASIDVTNEKRQLEEFTDSLKEQLRRNERLISTTLDGYVLTSEDGNIIEVNESYSKITGYSESELLRLKLDVLELAMLPLTLKKRKKEISEKKRTKFETRYITKNGDIKSVEVSLSIVEIKNHPTTIAHFVRDITKRKQDELRKVVYNNISQELNTDISVFDFCRFMEKELIKVISINSIYVMLYEKESKTLSSIYIKDPLIKSHENVNRKNGNGICEYMINNHLSLNLNKKQFEKFINKENLKQYRAINKSWMGCLLMSEEKIRGVITIDSEDNLSKYSVEDLELLEFVGVQLGRLIARKESSYKIRVLNTTLEDRVNLRTYELEKAKNNLAKSLETEKELSNLKSRFVSTASHQFRTPLTVIQTNIGILELQKDKMDESYQAVFNKIAKRVKVQVHKMTSMMDDLLTIGKIDENGIRFKPAFIDVQKLTHKIIVNYNEIQLDNRVIELEVLGEVEEVFLDSILMEHVLSALISNAFKYSKGCPCPKLKLSFFKDKFLISVIDFGIGIKENEIEHIYEPFFRGSNAIEIQGTGLGTSIIKEYVEQNKGTLTVESELNKYTEFKLIFIK